MRGRALLLALCIMVLAAPSASAQEEAVFAWTLQLGSDGITTPTDMLAADAGGLYITGYTDSAQSDVFGDSLGGEDGLVLRVDANGALLWARRLGGSGEDRLGQILEIPGGGCVVLGTTTSTDGDARAARGGMDAWVVRLNALGETVWSKCLGGSLDDELLYLSITEDGQYFACGRSQSRNGDLGSNHGMWDAWATLLSPEDGKPIWFYRYGAGGEDAFTKALPIVDGWALVGETAEALSVDEEGETLFAQRPIAQIITAEGTPVWDPAILLGDTGLNRLFEIVETETGWLLAGETNSRSALMPTPHGGLDIWVAHMRQNGYVSWQRSYGGAQDERLYSLIPLPDGDYLLLCTSESMDDNVAGAHGSSDVWVVRISSSGVRTWEQALGGSESSWPADMLLLSNGGMLVAGTTTSQDGDIGRHASVRCGFLSHLAPNGNLLSTRLVMPEEENALVTLCAADGIGYVLGSVRSASRQGVAQSLWVARLEMEGFTNR